MIASSSSLFLCRCHFLSLIHFSERIEEYNEISAWSSRNQLSLMTDYWSLIFNYVILNRRMKLSLLYSRFFNEKTNWDHHLRQEENRLTFTEKKKKRKSDHRSRMNPKPLVCKNPKRAEENHVHFVVNKAMQILPQQQCQAKYQKWLKSL